MTPDLGRTVPIFFQRGRDLIVVNGFIKKTQKTPDEEIGKARTRLIVKLDETK